MGLEPGSCMMVEVEEERILAEMVFLLFFGYMKNYIGGNENRQEKKHAVRYSTLVKERN